MYDRVAQFLIRWLSPYWVSLALVLGLISVTVASIDQANWTRQDANAIQMMLVGLALGWLLARSRFGGQFVLGYAALMGLLASVQAAGNILPGLPAFFDAPLWHTLDGINLRLLTFWLRLSGWVEAIRGGGEIEDTGLFVLLLTLLLWGLVVWLTWFLIRKRQALIAILPLSVAVAFNVHLSQQSLSYYWMYLFFAVLLLARVNFLNQVREWEHRRIDFSDQLGLDWAVSAVIVSLVVLLLARGAPLVGTPDGWKAIADWVERTNQQASHTTERIFAGVNTPPPRPVSGEPPVVAAQPNLHELGSPLPQGGQTVMWVSTSDPPPNLGEYAAGIPQVSVKGHYWRNGIYSAYTGRGWEQAPLAVDVLASQAADLNPPDGRYYLRQQFDIVAQHSPALFSVNGPIQSEDDMTLRQTLDGSPLLEGERSQYAVISTATRVSADQLAQAGQDYPEEVSGQYLQLPDSLPGRVRVLAARVAGEGDPFHQALRVQDYLRQNYPYDLGTPPAPEGKDVVDHFLFDEQKGFCSHYASAMVVMLRTQGVPARVVTGYATGSYNTNAAAYRVTEGDSHAWVEVYFPGFGWVEFEPTASRSAFTYVSGGSLTGGDSLPLELKPVQTGRGPGVVVWVVLGLVILALLVAPVLVLRLFSLQRQRPATQQAGRLYVQMRRALIWAGLAARASMTPEEYRQSASGRLARYNGLLNSLHQATNLYQQAAYSDHPPEIGRVHSTLETWRKSFGQWLQLWFETRWKR